MLSQLDQTQPTNPAGKRDVPQDQLSQYQPIRLSPPTAPPLVRKKERPRWGCGCLVFLLLFLLLAVYYLFPIRTNIVLMGIDDRNPGSALGRTDTLILLTLKPVERYVGMLSIPRDLWVSIPGIGENRINTAHFFAEAEEPGSGPEAVKEVIRTNFGVDARYYVRARFDNFKELINLLGGVEITLTEPMGGYPEGKQTLDADQALAFVRDRTSGGDDFARMRQTQVFVVGLIQTVLSPGHVGKWPQMAGMILGGIETDIPVYGWPRLAVALLSALPDGIDGRVINRDLVNPFTTDQGAQVLAPNWDLIRPVLQELFGD